MKMFSLEEVVGVVFFRSVHVMSDAVVIKVVLTLVVVRGVHILRMVVSLVGSVGLLKVIVIRGLLRLRMEHRVVLVFVVFELADPSSSGVVRLVVRFVLWVRSHVLEVVNEFAVEVSIVNMVQVGLMVVPILVVVLIEVVITVFIVVVLIVVVMLFRLDVEVNIVINWVELSMRFVVLKFILRRVMKDGCVFSECRRRLGSSLLQPMVFVVRIVVLELVLAVVRMVRHPV